MTKKLSRKLTVSFFSAPFAAGQLYHSINQFENAYMQYKIAASDARLANNRIGKTSKLMVARYILSYIPAMPESGSGDHPVNCLGNATKQEAFNILLRLAENDGFAPAFYWLGKKGEEQTGYIQLTKYYHQPIAIVKAMAALLT